MSDQYSIVLYKTGHVFYAWYWKTGFSRYEIYHQDGEEKILWEDGVWDVICTNLQVNKEKDSGRLIVFSDSSVEEITDAFLRWDWSVEEIKAARELLTQNANLRAGNWFVNGRELPIGKCRKIFPVAADRKTVYVTMQPDILLNPKPKDNEEKEFNLFWFLHEMANRKGSVQ